MDSESLTATLRAYAVSFDATAVKTAFEHGNGNGRSNALVDWATIHITPDTLLSADELDQFTALEKSGLAEKLAATSDLATVQALSDQEIKDAIEELNRSTEAISRQTETLKQQQEALDRLVNGSKRDSDARSNLESLQTRKWETQRRSAALAVSIWQRR
jgi:hypothetical protein